MKFDFDPNKRPKECPWIPVTCLLPETFDVPDYSPASREVLVKRKLDQFETGEDEICSGWLFKDGTWKNSAGNKIYVTHWRPK